MRLAAYERAGQIYHGALEGEPGAETVREIGPGDLLALLESGDGWLEGAREAAGRARPRPIAEVNLRAPIRRPPKLLALAGNYQEHVREGGVAPVARDRATPLLFLKPSSAIIAAGEPVRLPAISAQVDYELELGVVIGRACKDVRAEEALAAAGGDLAGNDLSGRRVHWGAEREMSERMSVFGWPHGH